MDLINSISEDFKYRFLRDISILDIIFVLLLAGTLIVALLSEKIAKRYKSKEKDVLRLSVQIKSAALIITAILAVVITQFF